MEKNLKLVCPKCGAKHNPNSRHSMDASDFIEGDIRTIMEERGWCFQCACWQNIYNVHKDDPGWVRIDGVSWIINLRQRSCQVDGMLLDVEGERCISTSKERVLLCLIILGARAMFQKSLRN